MDFSNVLLNANLINNNYYYHDQPGSNNIIVYCKHITHERTRAHTRAHTHTHTPPSPFRLSLFDGSVALNRDGVTPLFVGSAGDQRPVAASFK